MANALLTVADHALDALSDADHVHIPGGTIDAEPGGNRRLADTLARADVRRSHGGS